jgi:hypothetical protein
MKFKNYIFTKLQQLKGGGEYEAVFGVNSPQKIKTYHWKCVGKGLGSE